MLQVEVRGSLDQAPTLLKQLKKAGAKTAEGYALVPMRTATGEASFIVMVEDSPNIAASLRHLPEVVEVYGDVPVAPFSG